MKPKVNKKLQARGKLRLTKGFVFSSYRRSKQYVTRLTSQNTLFGEAAFKEIVERITHYYYYMFVL